MPAKGYGHPVFVPFHGSRYFYPRAVAGSCSAKSRRPTTQDGFELVMGANYFGHVYLAEQLLELMTRTSKGRGGGKKGDFSRVIFVSSKLNLTVKFDSGWRGFDLNMNSQAYHQGRQYARAKLAQAMYIRHLAKRMEGSNVAAMALCPGTFSSRVSVSVSISKIGYSKSQSRSRK